MSRQRGKDKAVALEKQVADLTEQVSAMQPLTLEMRKHEAMRRHTALQVCVLAWMGGIWQGVQTRVTYCHTCHSLCLCLNSISARMLGGEEWEQQGGGVLLPPC